jgi:hypothetical protein
MERCLHGVTWGNSKINEESQEASERQLIVQVLTIHRGKEARKESGWE